MNYNQFALLALEEAERSAQACYQQFVGTESILIGLLSIEDSLAAKVLTANGMKYETVVDVVIDQIAATGDQKAYQFKGYSSKALKILADSEREAFKSGCDSIGTEHILIAIIRESDCIACRLMQKMNVNLKKVYIEILLAAGLDPQSAQKEYQYAMGGGDRGKKQTSMLETYCVDLTAVKGNGNSDPVIGRVDEINRMIQILSRRTKNSPCLVGEPGVGKTAIVEGLAQWIAGEEVPENLIGKRILTLDLAGLVAGSKFRGEFEERIRNLLQEIQANGDIILFIDEIHTMIGAGGAEGSMDASNIVKPFLARGELQVIGATTREEYRKYIEKDAAFERRFQPVDVEEPSEEETAAILFGLKDAFEKHHHVTYSKAAIEAAAALSKRYISDRFLPDKAIDVMDEAAAMKRVGRYTKPESLRNLEQEYRKYRERKEEALLEGNIRKAKLNNTKQKKTGIKLSQAEDAWNDSKEYGKMTVTEQDVAEVVAAWTKIPVARLNQKESEKLLALSDTLKERVIGQDEAVEALSKAIKRGRVGMKDPKRPIGSFMFLGPTGVGKTELCKALSETLFGDEKFMIRVDMSEYMEKHSVSKMIGSPPGYVGYEDGGQLSEQVRRHPYSVILFDEIEKAHPDVFNILLQVLDDGQITDSNGRTIDFKNTVIIMTSNAGAQRIMAPKNLGFRPEENKEQGHKRMEQHVMEEVKKLFKPEFINRVDGIIVFKALEKAQLKQIVKLQLRQFAERIAEHPGIQIETDEEVVSFLLEKGYDPMYGARPIRRAIQDHLEDMLSDAFLNGTIKTGSTVKLTVRNQKIIIL